MLHPEVQVAVGVGPAAQQPASGLPNFFAALEADHKVGTSRCTSGCALSLSWPIA